MSETKLKEIEKLIGYTFNNKSLLRQAFTTTSSRVGSGYRQEDYQIS